tara:strand:+ start:1893 stop:2879 length:987 start_codon:yes stop_codon:yes gene_type:complete
MNTAAIKKCPTLAEITAHCVSELRQLDQLIVQQMTSSIPLIQEVARHILRGSAKRLRPLLVILSAHTAHPSPPKDYLLLAAIIEFVHTATLLHDDVVDESDQRRGHQTANTVWGNSASVLVGDFLYSRAFQMLTEINDNDIMRILADATNTLAEGEVLQLMNRQDTSLTEETYLDVIYRKTAKLFESSAEIVAVGTPHQSALAEYGKHVGLCFQIVDDILDYTGSSADIGKNVGDDLAEGKITLPLIYALETADLKQQQTIQQAINNPSPKILPDIMTFIQKSDAIQRCHEQAERHCQKAINAIHTIPESIYKQSMLDLVEFALLRHF